MGISAALGTYRYGEVKYGAGSGGTESNITDGGISYRLHSFTTDANFTVTTAGIFELFLCGGGGGPGVNFIGRTAGDSGGTGAAVTICKLALPVGTYAVDVGAAGLNSTFAFGTDYQVIGIRGNAGGSSGEYSFGPDTSPPLTKLTVSSGWPSNGRDADTYIAPVGRVGQATAAKAYDVVLYDGKKSVSNSGGGSALNGVSLTFSGTADNYGSGGAYSNGQQGIGAGARSVSPTKYGAGGGGGDSNGGSTSGFQGIVMVRYRI